MLHTWTLSNPRTHLFETGMDDQMLHSSIRRIFWLKTKSSIIYKQYNSFHKMMTSNYWMKRHAGFLQQASPGFSFLEIFSSVTFSLLDRGTFLSKYFRSSTDTFLPNSLTIHTSWSTFYFALTIKMQIVQIKYIDLKHHKVFTPI